MTASAIRSRYCAEYHRALKLIPNRDVEAIYVKRAKQGDRIALSTLIYKYIPFLYKMANQLRESAYNLTIDEMVNASIFGFPKAINAFDPTLGIAFYTYYSAKAANEMRKAGYDSLLVHRPENQIKSKRPDKITTSVSSIYDSNEDGKPMVDTLSDSVRTDELANRKSNTKLVSDFMNLLLPNEKDVISKLFLGDDDTVTLRSVSLGYGVSHERIRQIKESALRRIRESQRYNDIIGEAI